MKACNATHCNVIDADKCQTGACRWDMRGEPSPEDLLALAVADFLRDHERSATRVDAAKRVNEYAARLGISASTAIARAAP